MQSTKELTIVNGQGHIYSAGCDAFPPRVLHRSDLPLEECSSRSSTLTSSSHSCLSSGLCQFIDLLGRGRRRRFDCQLHHQTLDSAASRRLPRQPIAAGQRGGAPAGIHSRLQSVGKCEEGRRECLVESGSGGCGPLLDAWPVQASLDTAIYRDICVLLRIEVGFLSADG